MRKMIAGLVCLVLLAGLCAAGNAEVSAEQTAKETEAIAEWEKEYGESQLWDYRVSAAFAAANPDFFDDPSMMPVLPDENDSETISAEKAEELAVSLLPRYPLGITADALSDLACVVSSYRKPDHIGEFFSANGSWNVTFWNTSGETPEMAYSLFLEATSGYPDVLMLPDLVRYECQYEEPEEAVRIDPNGTMSNGESARFRAREIAHEQFGPDSGMDDYYTGLVSRFGLFTYWTPEQKYEYCAILDELCYWEVQRLSLYYGNGRSWGTPLDNTILQWKYGNPADAAVSEEDARMKAVEFLQEKYDLDCEDCPKADALVLSNCNREAFADPWWVISFWRGEERRAEVWVNANSGNIPEHLADEAEAVAVGEFTRACAAGLEIAGIQATADMAGTDNTMAVYLEEDNRWDVFIMINDSFWEISLDADTLDVLDTAISNG